MQWLTHDDFAGRIGETFTVATADGGRVALVLVEATLGPDLGGPGPDGATRHQFALVLDGPDGLGQAVRRVEHGDLGTIDLFLVPIGHGRYEAAFG
ncbi:DUF6916 family protein [Nocardioides aromaticivorans]|uniref:DUF6916 family protein n=1 Tax=Nocardioides aromaticivorans TaxID=200618 RepID=UPI00358DCEE3